MVAAATERSWSWQGGGGGGPHERLEEGLVLTKHLESWPGNQGVACPRVTGRECLEKGDVVSRAMCCCEQGCVSKGRHRWGSVCQEMGAWGPCKAKLNRWVTMGCGGLLHQAWMCSPQGWGQHSVLSPHWPGQRKQRRQPTLCDRKRTRALVTESIRHLTTQQGQLAEE